MRVKTVNRYSSPIASFATTIVDPNTAVQEHNIQLLQRQGQSIPILKKTSTDFSTVYANPKATETNGGFNRPLMQTTNSISTGNACNTSSLKRDVTDSVMTKVPPPVITPPPPQTKNCYSVDTHPTNSAPKRSAPGRLNKFVRRLHEMLLLEQSSGIVEWRKGLLVLHSTDAFTKKFLPKYFGTKNFKTFRRQLNYYGFVHVRSFSATGSTTTALWVNQDLAKRGTDSIASVLMLKRVEPSESSKTAEGRRVRKEEAASTVEDIGINTRTIQLEQIRNLATQSLEKKLKEQAKVVKIDSNLIVPIISLQNCQQSQTGTDSTASNTSSRESSTVSSPVPASINISYPCANSVPSTRATSDGSNTTVATASSSSMGSASQQSVPISDTSTDDAANLLMMFSRSTVQMKN